ncbi:Tripartite ATP-independent periplasmic transporter, DctQ component [Roseobacter sp. SK209-2-6]|uniref:TRAP transporter small permease n=1 Tax=Roseobacter sp. SK209-2-6 TaxID=388739 RepID=UPI0000F3E802|nr:TRAP transporter small permease subunit [Roseobacter sp. SK209-2-6]EBA16105.1 Tripartite ATP-independent periplasmic transporter, DctQ component [Roseobacter sp. SK209-2-6]
MKVFLNKLSRVADFIAAMTLAAVFVTFLIQIFSRYAAKIAWLMPIPPISNWMVSLEPIGWTVNLISLLWVWIVFFGCAFIVKERDHVTFDVLYLATPRRTQRILALVSALGLIAAMLYSFPATWDAIFGNRLMELKKIQTLRMPITGDKIAIKWLFAAYILLMVTTILRYLWRLYSVARHGLPETELEELLSDKSDREDAS